MISPIDLKNVDKRLPDDILVNTTTTFGGYAKYHKPEFIFENMN